MPEFFRSFRSSQEEAIEFILTSEKRFCGLGAPPGMGKSLVATAVARLLGGHNVITTGTLGLQEPYIDMHAPGAVDMRGRKHFQCWESSTCEMGGLFGCEARDECPYLERLSVFNNARIGYTSYAWWLT